MATKLLKWSLAFLLMTRNIFLTFQERAIYKRFDRLHMEKKSNLGYNLIAGIDVKSCSVRCTGDDKCLGFNHGIAIENDVEVKQCELVDKKPSTDGDIEEDSYFNYYQENCDDIIQSIPCLNGGTLIFKPDDHCSAEGSTCQCTESYYGNACEKACDKYMKEVGLNIVDYADLDPKKDVFDNNFIQDCYDRCNNTPNCYSFIHDKIDKVCYFKNTTFPRTPANYTLVLNCPFCENFILYTKNCTK